MTIVALGVLGLIAYGMYLISKHIERKQLKGDNNEKSDCT